MTVGEALRKVSLTDMEWARPVTWKGRREAFCVQDGYVLLVPTPHGGDVAMATKVEDIAGDWEVVSTDTVLFGE